LQFQYVDAALGQFVNELAAKGLSGSTLIIVSAKHGQSPIDVKDRVIQSDAPFQATPGYGTSGFEICDDEGLIWLQPDLQQANYDAARAYLLKNAGVLHIQEYLADAALRRSVREQPRARFHRGYGSRRHLHQRDEAGRTRRVLGR
jgi:hypothetical protein